MKRVTLSVLLVLLVVSACGYPQPTLTGGDGGRDSNNADGAPSDAPSSLAVTVSPSAFVVHPNDTRLAQVTVTNNTTQTSGTPVFAVTGLTLGTMTFTAGTCTTGLAPGASCTATGHLTATTAGQTGFDIVASATEGGTAMVTLSVTVMPACASTCGPNGTTNCCQSSVVPGNATGATLAGAPFYRSYDVANDSAYPDKGYPATVGDFRLDTYEVTVGRFRAFVAAGMGTQASPPAAGAGAHSAIANSGWDSGFNGSLVSNQAALVAAVKCSGTTWTDTVGANESLPMNCITWYEAMAFCDWDGGYLATEAEWNYAAAGGSEQRAYPWSSSLTVDCSYANYFINSPSGTYCVNGTTGGTNRVGSESPKGDGKWGQSDLAGNVLEWTLDWNAPYADPCNDCANLTVASGRLFRGGGFGDVETTVRTAHRNGYAPSGRGGNLGVRCGRTP